METNCTKQWFVHTKKADFIGLAKKLGVDPVLVRIMRNRDIETEDEMRMFLYGGLDDLNDPALLPDADQAADLVIRKLKEGKKIRVVGDYDIDGVCATYILVDALKNLGGEVSFAIPERIRDGYGINRRIVEGAIEDGIDTIITCDNGISAIEEMKFAKQHGITVILTDHHDLRKDENGKDVLPEADFVVTAKREDSQYPEQEICGAVTAWKLIQLILRKLERPKDDWLKYLEFAALATIGDVMKLTGENRIIASEGLKRMNQEIRNKGLNALVLANGIGNSCLKAYHCAFIIGPCINAGGRLETAERVMALFMASSTEEANRLAADLKQLNEQRKEKTVRGTQEAIERVLQNHREDKVLVVYLEDLHESLAGIVAGKLKEAFGKPAYVLTPSEALLTDENGNLHPVVKGSGRSIEAYDMFRKLTECDELLERYGGHPMAAGLSMTEENIGKLRERLNQNCGLSDADLIQKEWIDMEMPLSYITPELVEELSKLEPYGAGNPKPVFALRNVALMNRRIFGKNRNVLKMEAIDAEGTVLPATMFGEADKLDRQLREKPTYSILYYPDIDDFRGVRQLEIKLEDFR